MLRTTLDWLLILGLSALAVTCAWHGWRKEVRIALAGAGLYACAAIAVIGISGILRPAFAAFLAFLAALAALSAAAAEGRKVMPDNRWKAAAWCARFGLSAGFGYLRADIRATAGWLRRRWQEYRTGETPDLEAVPVPDDFASPATPFQPTQNGAGSMPRNTQGNGTRPPANGTVQQPAIRARRIATTAGAVPVPAGWAAVVASTADFEAESNVALAQWMTEQVLGLAAWAESIVEQHETNRGMGIDPAAISMLHDVADAGVVCAQAMAGTVSQFCNYFELPDAFVDAGGQLAHSGDWHQGSPG